MNEIEFDKAFSEFLDDSAYDKASEYLFELAKAAFVAGWKAAMDLERKGVMDTDKK